MGVAVWLFQRSALGNIRPSVTPDLESLSKGKKYVLEKQAEVFLRNITDPLIRRYFCTVGSGQGIAIRNEAFGHYELSPFFEQAINTVPCPEGDLSHEVANRYVIDVISFANHVRGLARSGK
jgi:hypothetical protein